MQRAMTMWQAQFKTTTDVSAKALFNTMADIHNWSKWADDLEFTQMNGIAKAGASFLLKPRGGFKVPMSIEKFEFPSIFSDIAHFPLAKMRTTMMFVAQDGITKITKTLEVWGLLGFFWRRVVAEKLMEGSADAAKKYHAYARSLPQ